MANIMSRYPSETERKL